MRKILRRVILLTTITFILTAFLLFNFNPNSTGKTQKKIISANRPTRSHDQKPEKFNGSLINSSLPLLRDLYPGGFEDLGLSQCDNDTQYLAVVHSAPSHINRRRAIRESWAAAKELPPEVRVLFLVGHGDHRERLKDKNQNDIIVGQFVDSYRNLTLKTVAMLDWVVHNCPNIRYLLKCDDDIYVNVVKLIEKLKQREDNDNVIIGRIASGWKPTRDVKSKYFMSLDEYAPSVLPNFTTGPAYILQGRMIDVLLEVSLMEHWISLEDVFLTGIVGATRLGVRLENWETILNHRATLTVCNANSLVAIHNILPKEQSKILRLSKISNRSCAMRKKRLEESEKRKEPTSGRSS